MSGPNANWTPYRPSNGTEGDAFIAHFCDRCTKDSEESPCPIIGRTMAYDVDDPNYPTEWVESDEGATCTAFEPEGATHEG